MLWESVSWNPESLLSSLYLFISDSTWIIVIVFGPNYFKKMNDIYSDGIFSSLKEARKMDHED